MSHLSIYLDNATESFVKKAARQSGLSVSKWISGQLKKTSRHEWSASFSKLAGALPDFPSIEKIRTGTGTDSKREGW